MQQVLFTIPVFKGVLDPNGLPVAGFGVMLFLAFTLGTYWGVRRGGAAGMTAAQIQDMFLWVVLGGLTGARLLYMYQFSNQFPDHSPWALFVAFFQIWRGGIVFYGSALGGAATYGLFYWFVLRRLRVNTWALADAVAPILALGLAIGRIGCYLNGCCWGQVAVEEVAPVPLGGAHFPLLPAHCRDQLVRDEHLQTSTGFALYPRERGAGADPRSRVLVVEPGSPAAEAGLKAGDRIVKVNGQSNGVILEVLGQNAEDVAGALAKHRGEVMPATDKRPPAAYFTEFEDYVQAVLAVPPAGVTYVPNDVLGELARDWPRGRHDLTLTVRRGTETVELAPFVPRSVGLYPTQLYETVSMILLIGFLLAYYPFRRHDGQLMVLLMVCYAVHRFVNESLRVEPTYALGLTLSQWVSVGIFTAAVGMEAYLWRTKPSRWKPEPLPPPVAPPAPAA
ncbi:MAG: prolipoprotein diacylglyceryl transferase family protein [Gemmataceae bacterium]